MASAKGKKKKDEPLFFPPLSASEVGAYLKTGRVTSSTSSLANYLKDFPTQAENRGPASLLAKEKRRELTERGEEVL